MTIAELLQSLMKVKNIQGEVEFRVPLRWGSREVPLGTLWVDDDKVTFYLKDEEDDTVDGV